MLRVFGDTLGDEPGAGEPQAIDPESIEFYAPRWVRAASRPSTVPWRLANRESIT